MEEVIKIFKQIQSTSSLNEKKQIISRNANNDLFKKCLNFLLDKNFVTGISSKKIKKHVDASSKLAPYYLCATSSFDKVIDYLTKNNTGKDDDIYEIQAFLLGHEDEREFYAKLVNKCIPGLIPTFDVMLGTSIEKCKIKDGTWFSISQKLNGNRCIYYKGEFYTRQGKKYSGLDHIKKDLEIINENIKTDYLNNSGNLYYMYNYTDYVFDGELIYKNNENLSDSQAFQKGTGIAQSKSGNKEELKLVIFDMLPLYQFINGISKETYRKRKERLNEFKKYETENIEVVKMFYDGTDQSKIWELLDYAEQNDMEGVMVNLDTPYECKRTKNLIKVKKFYEFDLKIIGYEEGTSRNKDKLGAFIVDFHGNAVNVGSGFSDLERENFWKNKENYIGRVITVKYKEVTKDKNTGLESLQFPVYCGMREIGKEVSYD